MNKIAIGLIMGWLSISGGTFSAQGQISYSASVAPAQKGGYYNVELSQQIIAVSDENFHNLRILDQQGNEVPYLLRSESPITEVSRFLDYPLLSNKVVDSVNRIVVENRERTAINQFCIVVASADVTKYTALRGSNDQQKWYVLKELDNISYWGYKDGQQEYLIVNFSPSDYRYYEITLSTRQSSPLNVLRVGRFENSDLYSQLTPIDLGRLAQKDSSNKCTYLTFPEQLYDYRVCQLEFEVGYPSGYRRNGYLESVRAGFELSSGHNNSVRIPLAALRQGRALVIENQDNPPLKIHSVKAYGLSRYLCAYLEQGRQYTIKVSQIDQPKPKYDLERFQNEIPKQLETLSLGAITKTEIVPESRAVLWIERPIFLWSIIGVVGIFLGLLCQKVITEMRKRA